MLGGDMVVERKDEPRRADAQQNRDRILDAARELLLASAGEASMNSIAKQANVGAGTLYRHFPSREALVLAVYRHDVQLLVDAAPQLLEEHTPSVAMRLWFDRLASYGRIKAGLADVLHAMSSADLVGETYGLVIGAITVLMQAGQDAGEIRSDLDPDDVLLLLGFLWRIDPGAEWEATSSRMLDLVMDGLRAAP